MDVVGSVVGVGIMLLGAFILAPNTSLEPVGRRPRHRAADLQRWTAINLIDFFFVRHERYAIRELFKPHGLYGAWAWRGLGAYTLGFVVMIPFMSTTIYEGPVAKSLSGGDVSPFIGFPVAAIVYFLVSRDVDVDVDVEAEFAVADAQRELLEQEALAQEALGTHEEEDLLDDLGARVADGLEPMSDRIGVDRHPSA